jgi:hypothetical protein
VLVYLLLLDILVMRLVLAQRERGCISCTNYRGRLWICICLGKGWVRTCWIYVAWWIIDAWEWEWVRCCWGGERLVGYGGRGVEVTILADLLHELGVVHHHSL